MKTMEPRKKACRRIVVKIGSSLFYPGKKKLDFRLLEGLCGQIAALRKESKEIVVVSSGAIALGMTVLGLESRPKELAFLQAAAAIGQNELMDVYRRLLNRRRLSCAQVLLTWEDFSDRTRYLNAKNTLTTLLQLGAVPVINENDTVSTDEIKFGDNDQLSALVAGICSADLLIILSDVDGLLDRDKKTVIRLVDNINNQVLSLATSTDRKTSVGGMITKLKAARISVDSGIPCVIANGRTKDILRTIALSPQSKGTMFLPKDAPLNERDRWMAFSTKPKGTITVDAGAQQALLQKKSLLSVGVFAVSGSFRSGDVVSICDRSGSEFARGKTGVTAEELDRVKGNRCDKEIIHCDNIVIL